MKQVMVLKNMSSLKEILNKSQQEILQLLTFQEYSVQQLGKILNINPCTAYQHVKVLEKAGLVEETHAEIENYLPMRYYRTVAREFIVDYSDMNGKKDEDIEVTDWVKNHVKSLIDGLKAYNIEIPKESCCQAEELITQLVNLENKIKEGITPKNPEILENIPSSIAEDIFYLIAHHYLNQNKEYAELTEKLLNFLKKHETA
ncbi:MAG: ArsR/SmtB family transcription factor [Candidatus Wukongarchaeota archaeon]|jgi:predicted transcriptional regulator|nr:winged helix-turn-helix domain-containing protein [Candidatus Wukongarchaeota archaeon]